MSSSMPRDPAFDSTLALLKNPYQFISARSQRIGCSVFRTRILLQPTICMTGAKAAELFYDSCRFTRIGAAPEPLQATLSGKGGVQGLDGSSHRHRKAMFLSLLTPEQVGMTPNYFSLSGLAWRRVQLSISSPKAEVMYKFITVVRVKVLQLP